MQSLLPLNISQEQDGNVPTELRGHKYFCISIDKGYDRQVTAGNVSQSSPNAKFEILSIALLRRLAAGQAPHFGLV